MTARDRIVIVVVLVAAALAGAWFVALAPKRKQAAELQTKIDAATQRLSDAEQKASAARSAKDRYDADYAAVAKLGKAVPKGDALPSLVYQLQAAAHDARIDFRSVKVTSNGQASTSPPAAASSNGGSSSNSSSSSSNSSSPAPAPSTSPAPATQAASTTLPPGAVVGSAGFPTMPFSFVFTGSFFDMERFLHDVQRFVRVDGQRVDVSGRLLGVDGFALTAGPGGFPAVKAEITATAYLQSPDDTAAPAANASTPATSAGGATSTGTVSEVAR